MNKLTQILNNLKDKYRELNDTKGVVSYANLAKTLGMVPATLSSYKNRGKVPYFAILEYCNKNNINSNDIFYNYTEELCTQCDIELTDKNKVYYEKISGSLVWYQRGACRRCLSLTAKEAYDKKKVPMIEKKTHCKDCEEPLTDKNKVPYTFKTAKGTTTSFRGYCQICKDKREKVFYAKSKARERTCSSCDTPKALYAFDGKEKTCIKCKNDVVRDDVRIVKNQLRKKLAQAHKVKKAKVQKAKEVTEPIAKITVIHKPLTTKEKMQLDFESKLKAKEQNKNLSKEEQMIADFRSKNNVVMSRKTARYCDAADGELDKYLVQ